MHAVLLTLIVLGAEPVDGKIDNHSGAVCDHCGVVHGGVGGGGATHRDVRTAIKASRYMMPQTCYNPTYGCYRGSRYIHRYPPFHGTFYRRPYNYRTYFDYPWHAQPHEPTSLFSYNTAEEAAEEAAPEPPPSTSRSTPRPLSYFQPTIGSGVRQPASDSTTQRVRPVSAKLRR